MSRQEWQVMRGRGATVLDNFAAAIVKRDQYQDALNPLSQQVLVRQVAALEIETRVVDPIFDSNKAFDLQATLDGLSPEELKVLAAENLGKRALRSMNAIVNPSSGYTYGKKARLSVVKEGVLIQRRAWRGIDGWEIARVNSPMEPGEKIEGMIDGLGGNPKYGGHLCLRKGMFFTHMLGLVDPRDGTPRVDLNILATR